MTCDLWGWLDLRGFLMGAEKDDRHGVGWLDRNRSGTGLLTPHEAGSNDPWPARRIYIYIYISYMDGLEMSGIGCRSKLGNLNSLITENEQTRLLGRSTYQGKRAPEKHVRDM